MHGCCKRCSYQDCNNLEQQGALCVRHGSKKKQCMAGGCNNYAVKGCVCVTHGAKHSCIIVGCVKNMFQDKRCHFHYRCSFGYSGSDWEPSITRVMGMGGLEVIEYLGSKKKGVRFMLTADGMMCLLIQGCVNHGGKHLMITSTGSNQR